MKGILKKAIRCVSGTSLALALGLLVFGPSALLAVPSCDEYVEMYGDCTTHGAGTFHCIWRGPDCDTMACCGY